VPETSSPRLARIAGSHRANLGAKTPAEQKEIKDEVSLSPKRHSEQRYHDPKRGS
jgi:hypothetical protein